jgi:hypothetical protein
VSVFTLTVALGGTSYAVTKLQPGSVANRELAANAVTSAKVKDGSLTAQDFKPGVLSAGHASSAGPQGVKGDTGAAGPKGETGATGATGPKGDRGLTGPKGDTGAAGPEGPAGTASMWARVNSDGSIGAYKGSAPVGYWISPGIYRITDPAWFNVPAASVTAIAGWAYGEYQPGDPSRGEYPVVAMIGRDGNPVQYSFVVFAP